MKWLMWIIVGLATGRVMAWVMLSRDASAPMVNMGVGVVGAVIAGWFVAPLIDAGIDPVATGDPRSVVVSIVGAALLALRYNIVRCGDTD